MGLIEHLQTHYPRYGPEWGSGGIFGLKYHRDVLYYTLAFEAEAYFIDSQGIRLRYEFDKVGSKPTSGGDTYNAVEVVDEKIYFGGWVHAPAVYRGRNARGSTIDFKNKYSHVHYYDIDNNVVELVWKESMHDPEKWVGEISEIIYNPYHDELLLARADGYTNLGVYSLDPRKRVVEKVLDEPALKGVHHLDYACFTIHQYPEGFMGIECFDLIERRGFVKKPVVESMDGELTYRPQVGPVSSLYGRLFSFIKGGVMVSDIIDDEYYFIRLFDTPYGLFSPLRVNAINVGGGVLVAYNSYTHGVINVFNEDEKREKEMLSTITSPSLLLYITPPIVKPIAILGARVTSIETIGDKILIATNTMANTGRYDATPFDQGVRGFTVLSHDKLHDKPCEITLTLPGWMIGERTFGGLPLHGYREPKLIVYSKRENTLYVNEYYFTLPPIKLPKDRHSINMGRNIVDLSSYSGIVSFKFEKPLDRDELVIVKMS